ncbi:MAG: hypothetical protein WC707_07090 [Candidatus Babeliaceae bacterium]|jgi:hypothetical protein
MIAKDIVIGEFYRFKDHPNYSYAKAIKVLPPKKGENTNNYIVVKCEHVVNKDDYFGFVRHFKPVDLVRCE